MSDLSAAQHNAVRELLRVTPVAGELGERFAAAGHALHLVGGSVRDALLGRLGDDLDFTTDAHPDAVLAIAAGWAEASWETGIAFGTVGLMRRGFRLEITTYRAEAYDRLSRNPDVTYGDSLSDDLARRDFSVNAMAVALPDWKAPEAFVDPYGGLDDLAARVLRTPGAPQRSFGDDPLRMLRAARFVAGYGLTPDPELVDAVTRLADRLEIVSAERIRDELDKLVVVERPEAGLSFLVDTGLAEEFLPELPGMALEVDPIHRHKDVLAHTVAVVEKTSPDKVLRLAALLHDIGKPKTRSIGPKGVSFHHHEVVGARMARDRLKALRYPNDEVEAITELVNLHLRFHTYKLGWTDSAVRRYVRDAGPLLGRLNELTRCDCTTRNARRAAQLDKRMDDLEVRIAQLEEQEQVKALRPDLDGTAVMKILDLPPGPMVGRAMRFLLDLRLEEGPLEQDEVTRRLKGWWAAQQ